MPLQDNPTAAAAPLQTATPTQQQLSEPRAAKSSRRPLHSSAPNVSASAPSKRASNANQKLIQQDPVQASSPRPQQVRPQSQQQLAHLQQARDQLVPTSQNISAHRNVALLHSASSRPSVAAPAFTAALAAASQSGVQPPPVNSTVDMSSQQYQYRLQLQHQNAARLQAPASQLSDPTQPILQQDLTLEQQAQPNSRHQQAMLQHRSSHYAMQSSNPSALFANVSQVPNNPTNSMAQALNVFSATFRQPPLNHASAAAQVSSTRSQPSFSAQQALNSGATAAQFMTFGINSANSLPTNPVLQSVKSPKMKSRLEANRVVVKLIGVGHCVQQLMEFNKMLQRGQVKNSVEGFWKPFVQKFYAPNATILLDYTTQNDEQSIELPVEAMPLIFKSKYDSGVTEERLLMDNPLEFLLENGTYVVDCPRATILTTYQNSKVCTDGFLRVSFTKDKKIIAWEYSTKSHEELFSRDVIGKGPLPKPICTPCGIPQSQVMLFAIADGINAMKSSLESCTDLIRSIEQQAGADARQKAQAVKDDQRSLDIINHLQDATSMYPAHAPAKPKPSDACASQQSIDPVSTDFSVSVPRGLTLFGSQSQVQTSLQQQTSQPSLAQLQLAQLQAQKQLPQSSQLNLESSSRIPPNSIRAVQNNQMPPEMIRGLMDNQAFRNQPSPMGPGQIRNPATTEALLGHNVAWQASLPGSMGGVSHTAGLFPNASTVGVEQPANAAALNQLKAAASVGTPAGLSLFSPTGGMFDSIPKPDSDITADVFAAVPNRGLAGSASASTPHVNGLGESLGDGMFSDSSIFPLGSFKSSTNGTVAAAGMSSGATATGAKRNAVNALASSSKRRRSIL